MMDEESHVDPRSVAGSDHFDEAMQYDFAKFLVTLAVLALGAMLTLSQTALAKNAKPMSVLMPTLFFLLSGIFSFSAAAKLAKAGPARNKGMSAQTMLTIAPLLLSVGLGGLVFLWWRSL